MKGFAVTSGRVPRSTSGHLVVEVPAGLATREELFHFLADRLEFPGYFGQNWDAFEECLSDLSWLHAKEVTLWHRDVPLAGDAQEQAIYLDILTSLQDKASDGAKVQAFFPLNR